MPVTYIDTHAHVHDPEFGEDADAVIARAGDAGVSVVVTLGVTLEDSRRAVAFAKRFGPSPQRRGGTEGIGLGRAGIASREAAAARPPDSQPGAAAPHVGHAQPGAAAIPPRLVAAVGVHPHDAEGASDFDLDALEELAAHRLVAMVGEIGLDYYRDLSPRDVQRRVLARQLETAARVSKPVALHGRDAHDDLEPMLASWSRANAGTLRDGRPLGLLHYFSGDVALALRYIELGFMISVHTSVTHPKAATLQAVAREAPLASLVIETDSPYGAPQRYRGKRNEPAFVVEAAAKIAELRGESVEAVASATTANAIRLLGLPHPPAPSPTSGEGELKEEH